MQYLQAPHAKPSHAMATRSPTARSSTSGPSFSTIPTPSWPGMNGGVGFTGPSPWAAWVSVWDRALGSKRTSTSPGPASGTGTSVTSSGRVKSVTTAAFMVVPSCWGSGVAGGAADGHDHDRRRRVLEHGDRDRAVHHPVEAVPLVVADHHQVLVGCGGHQEVRRNPAAELDRDPHLGVALRERRNCGGERTAYGGGRSRRAGRCRDGDRVRVPDGVHHGQRQVTEPGLVERGLQHV